MSIWTECQGGRLEDGLELTVDGVIAPPKYRAHLDYLSSFAYLIPITEYLDRHCTLSDIAQVVRGR